jgi:ribosomal protein S18 acetylase RimI-like enzyme
LLDVDAVVRLHARLIGDSVFARFGPGLLTAIYRGGLASPVGAGFAVDQPGLGLSGFIFAAKDSGRLFSDILRGQWPRLALDVAAGVLRRPALLRALAQVPAYFRRRGGGSASAELLFIAVDPQARRQGQAEALVSLALDRLREQGARQVHVTLDEGNRAPEALLEKFGFRRVAAFEFLGKNRILMRSER